MSSSDVLALRGVRENNLKNISLEIPHDTLTVITGVSGSGKSSLAFDTIYAEGGRRYIETFSPYTRQFLDRLHQPDLDSMTGVRPALALEQRNRTTSSRSTVGTTTEINDYLKMVWAHLSDVICPNCGTEVVQLRPSIVAEKLLANGPKKGEQLYVCFQLDLSASPSPEAVRETLLSQGFIRYFSRAAKSAIRLEDLNDIASERPLRVVVERFRLPHPELLRALLPSLTQAYHFGHGELVAVFADGDGKEISEQRFREQLSCPTCERTFSPPSAAQFSFNSPIGACKTCQGFGKVLEITTEKCIPDPTKSIEDGAIAPWSTPATRKELNKLKAFCKERDIPLDAPWFKLGAKAQGLIMNGEKGTKEYKGLRPWFERLKQKRHKMHVRVFLARYRSELLCPECNGSRLKSDALLYKIQGKTLADIWQIPIDDLLPFFGKFLDENRNDEFAEISLGELVSRIQYLSDIGLGYLTLDRQTRTLSGGESQRANLTSILGSRLKNTTLVLDEPTIGLHPTDTSRLLKAVRELQQRGNTVVLVEHDTEMMRAADHLIDLGPGSGEHGGTIIFEGKPDDIRSVPESVTGQYLVREMGAKREGARKKRSLEKSPRIVVRNASAHNLKGVDVAIPLGGLAVVAGVSGSGKSSFVHKCLYENARRALGVDAAMRKHLEYDSISGIDGLDFVDDVVLIDQSPIGKSPRSNAATYTKAWDIIRDLFASTEAAQQLGLSRSAFSFNVPGGRCPSCEGAGAHRIEMQFLADVFVECETCHGTRFKDVVLGVKYQGHSVLDFLGMSLDEASKLFRSLDDEQIGKKIHKLFEPLLLLGLGYLRLGQPLSEVSGGEAQRIKLASYLSGGSAKPTLFILDEPTTGLHPHNITDLLLTFDLLLSRRHSILCVEHNLDVLQAADWLIELGPGAGAAGGQVIASGPLETLLADTQFNTSPTLKELLERASRDRSKISVGRQFPQRPKARATDVKIIGAREHNLKNVNVSVPTGKITVFTGVSGSGKSTLAFDILFQEGQRRYIDSLSPYARQYLTQVKRAEVDSIDNIAPTVAVSQKTAPPAGVSTIGTTSEIYQFLRLLYCKAGEQHCPEHDLPIVGMTTEAIVDQLVADYSGQRIHLFAPVISGRKGYYNELFVRALRADITEARIDGKIVHLTADLRLERHKLHWISLLIGSITVSAKGKDLLHDAVEQALFHGSGTLEIVGKDRTKEGLTLSTERVCPKCKRGFRELDPQDFSFRSLRGVCERCGGLGQIEVAGTEDSVTCPECDGARIGPIGRHVYLNNKPIAELAHCTPPELLKFLKSFRYEPRMRPVVEPIVSEILHRLKIMDDIGLEYIRLDRDSFSISGGEAQRLRLAKTLGSPLAGICYILDEPTIGLHPQDHDQVMRILRALRDSGNTVVVVEHDEETILGADHVIDVGPGGGALGGHIVAATNPLGLLEEQRSQTGQALAQRIEGARIRSRARSAVVTKRSLRDTPTAALEISNASVHNLRNVSARFPLGQMTVVCGVSGAGKSSLVHGSFIPALTEELESTGRKKKKTKKKSACLIRGADRVQRLIEIDQSPVGRTPTSCPASYLGIFDQIRKVFAEIPEAKVRGWNASYFSFNSGKGRCPTCSGRGFIKIPMSFLPDAVSGCEECRGLRYTPETLEIRYQGYSLGEILLMTMSEAKRIFQNHSKIHRMLQYVDQLGLGYLTLGQATHTLSGGEAQRMKIAMELGSREAQDTVYILDEPTVGLHMVDVEKLIRTLQNLIERGNTVIVVEHHLDVIRAADHIIELGPGPGEAGGKVVFEGHADQLASSAENSPTALALRSWDKKILRLAAELERSAGTRERIDISEAAPTAP